MSLALGTVVGSRAPRRACTRLTTEARRRSKTREKLNNRSPPCLRASVVKSSYQRPLLCDNLFPRRPSMKLRFLLLFLTLAPISLPAQPAPEPGKPFVVEYYYKTKWGHADEFLQLFKK